MKKLKRYLILILIALILIFVVAACSPSGEGGEGDYDGKFDLGIILGFKASDERPVQEAEAALLEAQVPGVEGQAQADADVAAAQANSDIAVISETEPERIAAEQAALTAQREATNQEIANNEAQAASWRRIWKRGSWVAVGALIVSLFAFAIYTMGQASMAQIKSALRCHVQLVDGNLIISPSPWDALTAGATTMVKPNGVAALIAFGDPLLPEWAMEMGMKASMLPNIAKQMADASSPSRLAEIMEAGSTAMGTVLTMTAKKEKKDENKE